MLCCNYWVLVLWKTSDSTPTSIQRLTRGFGASTITSMGAKKDIGRARRRWEQQVGPALAANATIERYRGTLDDRELTARSDFLAYKEIAQALDEWYAHGRPTYLVDNDLTNELAATPLPDGETPHEVFLRRPHETGLFVFAEPRLHPVAIEEGQPPAIIVFRSMLVTQQEGVDIRDVRMPNIRLTAIGSELETGRTLSITFGIPLGECWDIVPGGEERIRLSGPTGVDLHALHNFDRSNTLAGNYPTTPGSIDDWTPLSDLFHLGVNLMLYVSASEPDMVEIPEPVVAGRRVGPAHPPTVYHLGYRIGSALRAARAASSSAAGLGGTVTPHLRRAHWHRFWTGPRDGERKLVLKWVAQTFVNPDGSEYVPAVRPLPRSA